MRLNTSKVSLMFLFVFVIAQLSFGQRTTATFAGIVTDSSGAVLPGADIQLVNAGTAALIQRITSETGEFVLDYVPVGTYTLKIVMPGFKIYESRGIPLGAAQNVRRTYVMEVGSPTDSVTVTGEAPLVNTLSPEQRLSPETLEVRSLPMVNRNITNILEIGSGLTRGQPTANGQAGNRFRLNGLGGSAMTVTADGADANGNASSPTIGGVGGYNKIGTGACSIATKVPPSRHGSRSSLASPILCGTSSAVRLEAGSRKTKPFSFLHTKGTVNALRSLQLPSFPRRSFATSCSGRYRSLRRGFSWITILCPTSPTLPRISWADGLVPESSRMTTIMSTPKSTTRSPAEICP